MTGPRVETPLAQDERRLARHRDLAEAIKVAAIGHAAALYEMKVNEILAKCPPRPGFGIRAFRIVATDCPLCGHSGIRYIQEERPREGAPTEVAIVDGPLGFRFSVPRGEPVICIRECGCVKYEVRYLPLPEPAETVTVGTPRVQSPRTTTPEESTR